MAKATILKIKKLVEGVSIPKYETEGAAGFDLASTEKVSLAPGEFRLIKTGLAVEVPEGYELQIRPRSGLAFKFGITVLNSPGTVDSDYRNEVGVILINHGKEVFNIEVGDRIAQGVVTAVKQVKFVEVEELSTTDRKGGFGSTGVKGTKGKGKGKKEVYDPYTDPRQNKIFDIK